MSTAGVRISIHVAENIPAVKVVFDQRRSALGIEASAWMELDEICDLRDRAQRAIHILRERREAEAIAASKVAP